VRIAVSGTGTEVGKTWVSQALTRGLRSAGYRCAAIKPIESGGDMDSRALAEACDAAHAQSPYRFQDPLSPHLAAQRAGVTIDLEACAAWVERAANDADVVIVELAGGLLSPLTARTTNADLLRLLHPQKWLVVAPDRLGVLHDLKALLICVQHLGLDSPLVVLDEPARPDASNGTNESSLLWAGTCAVAARFRRGRHAETENAKAASLLIQSLGLTRTR
jgi:dethiobiotin synthetase